MRTSNDVRAVTEQLRLGIYWPRTDVVEPSVKRYRDRVAARTALTQALANVDFPANHGAAPLCGKSWSLAHTNGVGVALLSPFPMVLGVDIVATARVSVRHLAAITSDVESARISRVTEYPFALVWAIKEAADKAIGIATKAAPKELVILRAQCQPDEFIVNVECLGLHLMGSWLTLGDYLIAWVYQFDAGSRRWPR